MPYIKKKIVLETDEKTFTEKVLYNDDGKEMKCPLLRIALASADPDGWGKNDIPADADCSDDCVGWFEGCPFCPEGVRHTFKQK